MHDDEITQDEIHLLNDLLRAGGKAFVRRDPDGRPFVAIGSWCYKDTNPGSQAARVIALRRAYRHGFVTIDEPPGADDIATATAYILNEIGRELCARLPD